MSSKPFPFAHRFAIHGVAYRRLAIALGFSLLVHLLVLGGVDLHLPAFNAPESVVQLQLAQLVPAVKAAPPAALEKAGKPKSAPQLKPEPAPLLAAEAVTPPAQPQPAGNAAADESLSGQSVSSPVIDETVAAPVPSVAETTDDDADAGSSYSTDGATVAAAADVQDDSPSYVETDFDIRRSIGGGKVGVTHISYQAQADGSYVINSVSEAQGLLSLFLSDKLVQRSEGQVTENGLRPTQFLYQYGDKANKKQLALFDWQAGQLTLQTGKGTKTEPLPAGTQDLLSFMYQFMFVPPLEQMQLSVTNGKSLSAYTYSFEGEEQLSTKMGDIKTLHILKKGDDGEEKTELWLAVDYHYLPVKMRKTDDDGSVVEQAATHISTNTFK